jgi:hypothetical protein
VGRHQLLLLADRIQKAERVHPEADRPENGQRQQAQACGGGHPQALAHRRCREHEKRQHHAGGHLDPDAGHERGGAGPQAGICAGRESQRERQQRHDQGVVVRAAHGQHQQHRVQADEGGCPARRLAEAPRRSRDQRDRAQARGSGEDLQSPDPERGGRIAREREERAVGGVLERPADEGKRRVCARFGGHVRVGVEPVQGPHPREGQIAEHVLGDEGRSEHQEQVREHDGGGQRPPG